MSQNDLGELVSSTTSGTQLAALLRNWRDALHTMHSGAARPAYVKPGMLWLKNNATPWIVNLWTGTIDVPIVTLDPVTGALSTYTRAEADARYVRQDLAPEPLVASYTGAQLAGQTSIVLDLPAGFTTFKMLAEGLSVGSGVGAISMRCGVAGGSLDAGSTDYLLQGIQAAGAATPSSYQLAAAQLGIGFASTSPNGTIEAIIRDGTMGQWRASFVSKTPNADNQSAQVINGQGNRQVGGARRRVAIITSVAFANSGSIKFYGVR